MSKLKSHFSLHQILAPFDVFFGKKIFLNQFFHINLVMLYIFEKVLNRQFFGTKMFKGYIENLGKIIFPTQSESNACLIIHLILYRRNLIILKMRTHIQTILTNIKYLTVSWEVNLVTLGLK